MSKDKKRDENSEDNSDDSFGELMFSTIRKTELDPMRSTQINMSERALSIYTINIKNQHQIVKQIIENHKNTFYDWIGKRNYEIVFQNSTKSIHRQQFYQSIVGYENIMILLVLENDGLAFGCFDSHKIPPLFNSYIIS